MFDFERKSVEVAPGVNYSYVDEGAGPTLVLIPGTSGSIRGFEYQIRDLSKDFRVIAVDPRGHGESDKPGRGYNHWIVAKDFDVFFRTLALKDFVVLGHSGGNKIFLSFMELFDSSEVRGYIFSDDSLSCVPDGTFTAEFSIGLIEALESENPEERLNSGLYTGITGMRTEGAAPDPLFEVTAEDSQKLPPKAHASYLRLAHWSTSWWESLDIVGCPTLCIGGEASAAHPDLMRRAADRLKDSRLVIFGADEGGSHAMYIENPEKYNRVVREFMNSLELLVGEEA